MWFASILNVAVSMKGSPALNALTATMNIYWHLAAAVAGSVHPAIIKRWFSLIVLKGMK